MGEDDTDKSKDKKAEKKKKKKRKRSRNKTDPKDDAVVELKNDLNKMPSNPSKEEESLQNNTMLDDKNKHDDGENETKTTDTNGTNEEEDDGKDNNHANDDDELEQNDDDGDEEEDADKPKRKRKRKRKKNNTEDGPTTTGDNTMDERTRKLQSLEYTVFVEGIPFDVTEKDVEEFFVSQGCPDVIQLRLPQWQDTGRLRGYGHVVFDTIESRQKALQELNGKHLGKRYLSICIPKESSSHVGAGGAGTTGTTAREQPPGCTVVFVKNLPYHATEDDIQQAMQVCGKILYIRIARNFQSNVSKGFAYVEYKNPEGAFGAVQKAAKPFGLQVLGRPVFCDYDEGRIKGSFKTQDGRLWSKEHSEYGKKKK